MTSPNPHKFPSLDKILDYWRAADLLRHEDYVREYNLKLAELPSAIPIKEIKKNVELLKLWPLIEIARLHMKSVGRDLNADDRKKLLELETKYINLTESDDFPFLKSMDRLEGLEFMFLKPQEYKLEEFAKLVTLDICRPLRSHMQNTKLSKTKLFHDTIMGGTVYFVGKYNDILRNNLANKFSFMQRSFICVNHNDQPVYFMDNVESGDYSFKRLEQWRHMKIPDHEDVNRIEDVFYSIAGAMYLADELDINRIAPRDFELSELARMLGVREKKVFDKEPVKKGDKKRSEWKIGLDSKRKNTGVYSHSLYRGTKNYSGQQTRFQVIRPFAFKDTGKIYDELSRWHNIIISSNQGRRKLYPKSSERANVLLTLFRILENHPHTPVYRLEEARQKLKEAYGRVYKTHPPTF